MPELPEVEFARRSLVRWFDGNKLARTEGEFTLRTFREGDTDIFKALRGPLKSATRKGKYLMLTFGEGLGVIAHLGMTGKFVKRAPGDEVKWSRARFFLSSGEVSHFQDPRMFGAIDALPASEIPARKSVAKLGIDPLNDGL